MATPILSILIPTLASRHLYLTDMLGQLERQNSPAIEVLTLVDNGEKSIGQKRNELLVMATGRFTTFLDDDDVIAPDYVERILKAAWLNPDVITFKMRRYIDGVLMGEERMSFESGGEYIIDQSNPSWITWDYPPTHLCPVRAEIAKSVPFEDLNVGEDSTWQRAVYPLLNSEVFIDRVLYQYHFRTMRPGEISNRLRKDFGG